MTFSGKFAGIEDAQVGGGGVYFLAGQYRIRVERVKMFQSRKKDDLFIVEATILESSNSERPPGMKCSHVINLRHEAALGNIKMFIAAANGLDPENKDEVNAQVNEEVCEMVVARDNPLAGIEVNLQCTETTTREGNPFTIHRYSPLAAA